MTTENHPKVSVVMPFYNAALYIEESVRSILNQTFEDFELIAINDGSTDNSNEIVNSIQDRRVRLIDNSVNKGLVAVLNDGFALARGEYIARMDSDDVAHPKRLQSQVEYLDAHPKIALLGTSFQYIGKDIIIFPPQKHSEIVYCSLFNNPFGHPTIMLRKQAVAKFKKVYRSEYYFAEDYDLWCRMMDEFETANLSEIFLLYRIHGEQVSSKVAEQKAVSDRVRLIQLKKLVGVLFDFEHTIANRVLDQRLVKTRYIPVIAVWLTTVLARSLFTRFLRPRQIARFYKTLLFVQLRRQYPGMRRFRLWKN